MTNFDYTKEFDVDSSVINEVFYNENDNTAVLEVNGAYYKYNGVTPADLGALVGAYSVGAYYNQQFKHQFGPSVSLGNPYFVTPNRIGVIKGNLSTTTAKDLTEPTKEHSLKAAPATVTTPTAATREFSLSTPKSAPVLSVVPDAGEDTIRIVVHFVLEDFGDKVFKFDAVSENVEDAIDELRDHVGAFGAKGRVKKVVVKFD